MNQRDTQHLEKSTYWHVYYDEETVRRSNATRQEHTLLSTGVDLHVDLYPAPASDAPVVIFNHGAAGYCRLFVRLAFLYNARGFTVVLPDQRGQGFSGGRRGDYTIAECAQNVVDVAHWAADRCGTPLFLAGGSVGGGLSYYAAAAGAPARAIACLNLIDFGNVIDGLGISRLAGLARTPRLAHLLARAMVLLRPIDRLRIPFKWLGAFDKLMDERDADFQAKWDADPVPPRRVSLRSLASNLTTPPAVPLEQNRVPTLVLNQSRDRMVDVEVTRRNFQRLGGPKRYLEIPFGHWSNHPSFWETIVEGSVAWFKQALP